MEEHSQEGLRGDVMKPEALQAVVKHSIEKDFLEGRRETRKQWPVGICSLQKYFPFIKKRPLVT